MITQYYPSRKLIDRLLLEHLKKPWKICNEIPYSNFLPYSKKYINDWIANNLHGSTQLMMTEMMKSITCPKTLKSIYKNFHPDIFSILDDHEIREQVELDTIFGISDNEIGELLNQYSTP